jgi:Heterokaryon incompatibility protein (HET)
MWGDVQVAPPLRTMRHNYVEMKNGISARRMPRNFVDAVRTCRRLNIQYIWIDSLCILQDDKNDWEREAGTMHDVYRNAEFTIVA